ncbi:hypothetical protein BDV12DRAFT_186267 [Aspergillus spectabilis]
MPPATRNDFAIAIICALPLEADAVEALFDETYDRLGRYYDKHPSDRNAYINGRIGKHNVVLCYMPGMGKGSAASVAASLRFSYTAIKLALVVGICGGAPLSPTHPEIFLGDVVISNAVVEYDFRRQYPGGFQRKTDVKDTLGRPDQEIRTLLNALSASKTRIEYQNQILQHLHTLQQAETRWHHPQVNDVLFKSSYFHKHYGQTYSGKCCCAEDDVPDNICEDALEKNCENLGCEDSQVIRRREMSEAGKVSMHIGTVASADTVMKSAQHRDEITRKEKVLAFEMEGAGVWDNVSCIIIKGVCDYADSHKNKSWQPYAAATGASAAKAFLQYWRPYHRDETSKTRHLMIPFAKNPRFVGRQQEIQNIEKLISMPDGPKKLAITGLGGVGKTQVALELAYRMKDKEVECSIFWIPCTSYEAVEQACMAIAQMVGIQDVKPADVKKSIKTYFTEKNEKWLLVFDNADDLDMWINGSSTAPALKDFLPYNNHGHIIFTTRNRRLAVKLASVDVIHVPELDEETGLEFLKRSLIQNSLSSNTDANIALLEQLTFLPLAVTQAAAYINENSIGVSDYLLLLQEQEADVVELLSEDFGDDGRYKDVQNPVALTWLISFCQVQKLNQLAADYLSLMACVNPRNIPQSFFPDPPSKKRMTDALGLLSAYSFINIQPGDSFITLHRLVHLATRNWMRNEQQFSLYITKAADQFDKIFPDDEYTNRQLWREYLPHALSLANEHEFKRQQEHYIHFLHNMGQCLHSDGRFNEAEMLFGDILAMQQRQSGDRHPYTLTITAILASIYSDQGRWKEAEELGVQVLETRKQGRWKEAEELEVQVLKTSKQVLGLEHPDTLTSMHNLAFTWESMGKQNDACN